MAMTRRRAGSEPRQVGVPPPLHPHSRRLPVTPLAPPTRTANGRRHPHLSLSIGILLLVTAAGPAAASKAMPPAPKIQWDGVWPHFMFGDEAPKPPPPPEFKAGIDMIKQNYPATPDAPAAPPPPPPPPAPAGASSMFATGPSSGTGGGSGGSGGGKQQRFKSSSESSDPADAVAHHLDTFVETRARSNLNAYGRARVAADAVSAHLHQLEETTTTPSAPQAAAPHQPHEHRQVARKQGFAARRQQGLFPTSALPSVASDSRPSSLLQTSGESSSPGLSSLRGSGPLKASAVGHNPGEQSHYDEPTTSTAAGQREREREQEREQHKEYLKKTVAALRHQMLQLSPYELKRTAAKEAEAAAKQDPLSAPDAAASLLEMSARLTPGSFASPFAALQPHQYVWNTLPGPYGPVHMPVAPSFVPYGSFLPPNEVAQPSSPKTGDKKDDSSGSSKAKAGGDQPKNLYYNPYNPPPHMPFGWQPYSPYQPLMHPLPPAGLVAPPGSYPMMQPQYVV